MFYVDPAQQLQEYLVILNTFPTIGRKIDKIVWICTTSGVDKTMPVIRASEYKHKWQMKAVQDMKSKYTR